ncbi:MAG TPA: hypothetical protein VGG54_23005 [Trebonia sp.]
MSHNDWLQDCELADPDTAVVVHIHDGRPFRRLTAACGASLPAEDDSNAPSPDAPLCVRCAKECWRAESQPRWTLSRAVTIVVVVLLTAASAYIGYRVAQSSAPAPVNVPAYFCPAGQHVASVSGVWPVCAR